MSDFLSSRPIQDFCCQIEACSDFGKRGHGNLRFRGRGGKHGHIRMIYCSTCRKVFSERRGTVLSCSKLSAKKIVDVLDHVREGCGVRRTSRLVKVSQAAVIRLTRQAGKHAKDSHDELVAFSPSE